MPSLATSLEEVMARRGDRMSSVCRREGLGRFSKPGIKPNYKLPPVPPYEMFYFVPQLKLAWCPVYKAASTSWLHNICLLAGVTEEKIKSSEMPIGEFARKYFPALEFEDGEEALNASQLSFFIVRHPFERLLSAYRDKLEHKDQHSEDGTDYYYREYGQHIVRKYRSRPSHLSNFSRLEPTFEEFARYLCDIRLNSFDDHWTPYYISCASCHINYDVIAKFETLARDQAYIVKLARIDPKFAATWKHVTPGVSTLDATKKYFSSVPKDIVSCLYEKYKLDFDMFGYDVQQYFL